MRSGVIKPGAKHFEFLGIIWINSKGTPSKNIDKIGTPRTEACILTTKMHRVSTFSGFYFSSEKDYKTQNTIHLI